MEIPAWLFFSFWAIISISFLLLGFNAFDKTGLADSVSPLVMSLFKHFLAICTCHSSSYALIFRPRLKIINDRRYFWAFFGFIQVLYSIKDPEAVGENLVWPILVSIFINLLAWLFPLPFLQAFAANYAPFLVFLFFPSESFPCYFPIYALVNFLLSILPEYVIAAEEKICVGVHMAVESLIFLVGGKTKFFPVLVLFTAFFTSASWGDISGVASVSWVDRISGNESFRKLVDMAVASRGGKVLSILKEKKRGKLIGFAVGMVGTVLFQSSFQLTSFNHVVAFLYLTVAWLANLTLLRRASGDLGVFNFLLGNVIVGCTVGEFGLRGATWLACAASLLLYGLRLKLESLSFVSKGGRQRAEFPFRETQVVL